MLADSSNKIFRGVNYEIFLVLPVSHLGMVDNCTGFFDVGEFFNREGVADNILGHIFLTLFIVSGNSNLVIHIFHSECI